MGDTGVHGIQVMSQAFPFFQKDISRDRICDCSAQMPTEKSQHSRLRVDSGRPRNGGNCLSVHGNVGFPSIVKNLKSDLLFFGLLLWQIEAFMFFLMLVFRRLARLAQVIAYGRISRLPNRYFCCLRSIQIEPYSSSNIFPRCLNPATGQFHAGCDFSLPPPWQSGLSTVIPQATATTATTATAPTVATTKAAAMVAMVATATEATATAPMAMATSKAATAMVAIAGVLVGPLPTTGEGGCAEVEQPVPARKPTLMIIDDAA